MQEVFSDNFKFSTWRKLWIALARAQMLLGLDITKHQLHEMGAHIYDIDYEVVAAKEKEIRHDVMSHLYAFGLLCPKAKPIIHLGATSMFVVDNTDTIIMREALKILKPKLINVIANLSNFAMKYKDLPTLGFTHYQPAQPTTVGKRAMMWAQDFVMDLKRLELEFSDLKMLGNKGATGTQASFLELFHGDATKVKRMDEWIAEEMGFEEVIPISGQTITRKVDSYILQLMADIASSAAKFAGDIRLLQNLKEIEEPFGKGQTGSSAMAYKRNPMRSERICGLARHVITNSLNGPLTVITQWLERTLDDSANRRLAMAEAFLAVDAILNIAMNVSDGLVVYEGMISKHLQGELPFMATENILMWEVEHGGDRQKLHEVIKTMSQEVGDIVKNGGSNNLLERILNSDEFKITKEELGELMKPEKFIGLASQQTEEYYQKTVKPILEANADVVGKKVELSV
jgi:adenylosuccinate lyase